MKNAATACVVLTTWPADQPVAPFARAVIEARLAACVHVAAAGDSTYRWKQTIEEAREHQVLIKTTRARLADLEAEVRRRHPYEVPEWLVLDADGSAAYLAWIDESVFDRSGDQPSA